MYGEGDASLLVALSDSMPGGAQAIREPWRMATAYLADAGEGLTPLNGAVPADAMRTVERMIQQRLNSPLTSSMGRLFDGVAALAGVRQTVSYEGQAAMELEWLASGRNCARHPQHLGPARNSVRRRHLHGEPRGIDVLPVAAGSAVSRSSSRFRNPVS